MVIEDLRDHVAALAASERDLQAQLADVRRRRQEVEAQLASAASGELRTRRLGSVTRPRRATPVALSDERVRDAIVKFRGGFVACELAAELGCTSAYATRALKRPQIAKMVEAIDPVGNSSRWRYVAPNGPGEAFKAQQRLRVVEPELAAVGRPGGEVRQSLLGSIPDKEIAKVASEAIRDGWTLVHCGGKHPWRLERPGYRPVGLASTPTNSDGAAKAIRRQLRQREAS